MGSVSVRWRRDTRGGAAPSGGAPSEATAIDVPALTRALAEAEREMDAGRGIPHAVMREKLLRWADGGEQLHRLAGAPARDDPGSRRYDRAMTASSLARQVLALPYDERESVLAALLDSLESDDQDGRLTGQEWDRAWAGELEARLRDLDEGRVETIPAERVLAEMRDGVMPARR